MFTIKGYKCIDKDCNKRWCWSPGEYQHRGATGGGSSRNTGHYTNGCLHNMHRGCPDPVPKPNQTWEEYHDN
jgi:hypothetical protein